MFRGWWKIAIAAVVAAVVVISDALRGPLGITSIFVLSAMGFYLAIAGFAWFRQSRALDDWLRRQGDAPVIYSLSEETIESCAEVGSTKLKWDAFRSLAICDFDTLLVFPQHGALTMPTDQIPVEALQFLKRQFLAHGKRVEDRRKKANQPPEPTPPPVRPAREHH